MLITTSTRQLVFACLTLILAALPVTTGRAQDLSADEILEEIQRMAEADRKSVV